MGNKKDKNELSRKKKHKKHKKRREKEETEDIDVVTEDNEATQTLKLKIRFGGETLTSKVKGKADVSKDDLAGKVKKEVTEEDEEEEEKRNHSNDNEEDSWLDAMEKGDLDDYGEIKKNRDPAIMTARQRALKGESVEGEIELLQLPMYPERSMEEVEELERKRKLRAKKRRQDSKRKIEETKIQTIEKLLTKSQKVKKENKTTKKLAAHMRYTSNSDGFFISLSEEVEFPITAQEISKMMNSCNQIIEVDGCLKEKEDHLLPVHFLPEGKKCYDWINEDLNREDENIKTCERSSTKNSIYTQANIDNLSGIDRDTVKTFLKSAENGELGLLKELLVKSPMLVNCSDHDGYTAMHRASYSGHVDVVEFLLAHHGNINAKTNDGWQPLHCAARWNHVDVCALLLEHGADVNAQTNGLQTPLHFAALSADNAQLLEMLLLRVEILADLKNSAGDTPYDLAYRSGEHVKLFEMVHEGLKV